MLQMLKKFQYCAKTTFLKNRCVFNSFCGHKYGKFQFKLVLCLETCCFPTVSTYNFLCHIFIEKHYF